MKIKPIAPNTRFWHLTVLGLGKRDKHNHIFYTCKCKCGKIVNVLGTGLRRGDNKSCGCWQSKRLTIHGMSHSPEYGIWHALVTRCTNPKDKDWPDYGGRGIQVYPKWLGRNGFVNFLNDVGKRPHPKLTIDRINVNGDYTPSNVRWADTITQAHNKRQIGDLSSFSDKHIVNELKRRILIKGQYENVIPTIKSVRVSKRRLVSDLSWYGDQQLIDYAINHGLITKDDLI